MNEFEVTINWEQQSRFSWSIIRNTNNHLFFPPTFLKGCKDAVEFGEKTEVLGYCQFSPLNSAEQDNMISEGTMANIFNKKQGHAPLIYTHAQSHISIHRATFKSIHIVCSSWHDTG